LSASIASVGAVASGISTVGSVVSVASVVSVGWGFSPGGKYSGMSNLYIVYPLEHIRRLTMRQHTDS